MNVFKYMPYMDPMGIYGNMIELQFHDSQRFVREHLSKSNVSIHCASFLVCSSPQVASQFKKSFGI